MTRLQPAICALTGAVVLGCGLYAQAQASSQHAAIIADRVDAALKRIRAELAARGITTVISTATGTQIPQKSATVRRLLRGKAGVVIEYSSTSSSVAIWRGSNAKTPPVRQPVASRQEMGGDDELAMHTAEVVRAMMVPLPAIPRAPTAVRRKRVPAPPRFFVEVSSGLTFSVVHPSVPRSWQIAVAARLRLWRWVAGETFAAMPVTAADYNTDWFDFYPALIGVGARMAPWEHWWVQPTLSAGLALQIGHSRDSSAFSDGGNWTAHPSFYARGGLGIRITKWLRAHLDLLVAVTVTSSRMKVGTLTTAEPDQEEVALTWGRPALLPSVGFEVIF